MRLSQCILIVLATAIAGAVVTTADAKSKKTPGTCAIKGGRAPCDWVEACLLDGGIPERRPFSGKLVCCFSKRFCEGVPEPAAGIRQTPTVSRPQASPLPAQQRR